VDLATVAEAVAPLLLPRSLVAMWHRFQTGESTVLTWMPLQPAVRGLEMWREDFAGLRVLFPLAYESTTSCSSSSPPMRRPAARSPVGVRRRTGAAGVRRSPGGLHLCSRGLATRPTRRVGGSRARRVGRAQQDVLAGHGLSRASRAVRGDRSRQALVVAAGMARSERSRPSPGRPAREHERRSEHFVPGEPGAGRLSAGSRAFPEPEPAHEPSSTTVQANSLSGAPPQPIRSRPSLPANTSSSTCS